MTAETGTGDNTLCNKTNYQDNINIEQENDKGLNILKSKMVRAKTDMRTKKVTGDHNISVEQ